uniref:Uncharacterized protein n=1 Tax=Kalanchoe fedtschenkoi TaxID=63787 RepID=A0A7N0ZU42_KALFE
MGCAHFSCFTRSTVGASGGGGGQPSPAPAASPSFQTKEFVVRVIHVGGRQELYPKPLAASHLMRKHPGMCVARPDVFRNPLLSLLKSDEKLLLGHVYYLLPEKTAQKLKRRHAKKLIPRGSPERKEQWDSSAEISDESILSVRASYMPKATKSPKKLSKRGKKKHFVPPIQRNPSMRGSVWEPSMDSIQELSP